MTTIAPSVELLSKLGTIAQIVGEVPHPSNIDQASAHRLHELLADREVSHWLDRMHDLGFLNYQAE